MRRRLAAMLLLVLPLTALAQTPVGRVEISGQVQHPVTFSVEGLAALPPVDVQAMRENGAMATYVGPLLWPMLSDAGLVDAPGKGAHLQHIFVARGADGYAVAVAVGEIDPGFEGKPVIIATKQDGVILAAPRLVVPGDHKAGRAVRDLVAIEVH